MATEEDCCIWKRVYWDNLIKRITRLDLQGYINPLQGEVNLNMLWLEFLTHLDLRWNWFDLVIEKTLLDFTKKLVSKCPKET